MSNPLPALLLFAATIGAAWSLPRWRSTVGLSGELIALTALIALHGRPIFPETWFPGRTVELVVLCYTFVRTQKLWAAAPRPVEACSALSSSDSAPKNAQLLAFAAYVIGWSALGDSFGRWSSIVIPLLVGLMVIGNSRAARYLVPLPFLAGVMFLAVSGG